MTGRKRSQKPKRPLPEGRTARLQYLWKGPKRAYAYLSVLKRTGDSLRYAYGRSERLVFAIGSPATGHRPCPPGADQIRFNFQRTSTPLLRKSGHAPGVKTYGFSLWAGSAMVLLGAMMNLAAVARHLEVIGRLNRGESIVSRPSLIGIAVGILLGLVGIAMVVFLVAVS